MDASMGPNGPKTGNTPSSGSSSDYGRPGYTGATSGDYDKSAKDQSTVDKAKEAAAGAVDQTKEAVSGVVSKAQESVQPQIETQKDKAAGQLYGLADAVRQTSQQLHEKDQHGLANVIEQSAEKVDHLANYLVNRDLGHLIEDVERYSRREPTLFIGGALALGFIAARFLKSSRDRYYEDHPDSYRYSSYQPSYQRTTYSTPSYTRPASPAVPSTYPGSTGYQDAGNRNVEIE